MNSIQKNIYLLICIWAVSGNCKPKTNSSPVLEKEWRQVLHFGWALNLEPNGSFEYRFEGEGCGEIKGTYTKTETGFTYNGTAVEGCEGVSSGQGECKVKEITDHLFYKKELVCTGPIDGSLFGGILEAEEPRKIGNTAVRTVLKEATITEDAVLREEPSKSSAALECSLGIGNELPGEPKKVVPAGTKIFVNARTESKEKVDKWENYWYNFEVVDWFSTCRGWVFGEFVKF